MKKNTIILSMLTLMVFFSCEEKGIEQYDSGNYVGFTSSSRDTSEFSFFFYAEDVVNHSINVSMIGKLLTEDKQFKIVANKELTTLNPDLYEIPETMTFHAGQTKDSISITLKNTGDLSNHKYLLVLDVVDYGEINSAKGIYGRSVIRVSDIAVRPDWWTEKPIERYYLGKYSRKKFELFIKVTGRGDLTNVPLGDVRILTLKFQHWLDAQNPKIMDEENEELMQTQIIG